MSLYISIDPGIKKCGLLLADIQSGKVIEAGVASLNEFSDLVSLWNENHEIIKIIIGDGTNCNYIESKLKRKNFFNINYVNESCLLYTSPSPRDQRGSRMPSSA